MLATLTSSLRSLQLLEATFLGLLMLLPVPCNGDELRVAVATNFAPVLRELAHAFTRATEHDVVVSAGATGKLYAQIVNGAPYDIFLAADETRPLQLEAEGHAVGAGGFIYAVGKLVLWSPQQNLVTPTVLQSADFRYLAIANPRLAPYGAAAREVLEALGLWTKLQPRLVRGENIGQTLQFVRSRNADLGFIARSQHQALAAAGSFWMVPEELHKPLRQRAALLTDNAVGRDFMVYIQSPLARELISSYGYGLPDN